MTDKPETATALLARLRQESDLTEARVGLPRAGASQSTRDILAFDLDHARARDAVHQPFHFAELEQHLQARHWQTLLVHSAAEDRRTYLQRPDLGRKLAQESAERLEACRQDQLPGQGADLVLVIADGLSTRAIHDNGLVFLDAFVPRAVARGWSLAPLVIARQARVALADDIGQRLGARMSVILVGERPGLSAADSMGIYVTFAPQVGCTDARRNCISNVRRTGLAPDKAAIQLEALLLAAYEQQRTGVLLKP